MHNLSHHKETTPLNGSVHAPNARQTGRVHKPRPNTTRARASHTHASTYGHATPVSHGSLGETPPATSKNYHLPPKENKRTRPKWEHPPKTAQPTLKIAQITPNPANHPTHLTKTIANLTRHNQTHATRTWISHQHAEKLSGTNSDATRPRSQAPKTKNTPASKPGTAGRPPPNSSQPAPGKPRFPRTSTLQKPISGTARTLTLGATPSGAIY